MHTFKDKFLALLATGRVSNLPTVWSNCLVALCVTSPASGRPIKCPYYEEYAAIIYDPIRITLLFLAASSLYVGGCFLGDAIDQHFDADHKPDRPIPSGVLKQRNILVSALLLLGLPLIYSCLLGFKQNPTRIVPTTLEQHLQLIIDPGKIIWSCMLVSTIILYSIFHKRNAYVGLGLMGSCRMILALWAASMFGIGSLMHFNFYEATMTFVQPPVIYYGLCVGAYTICFASVARSESCPSPYSKTQLIKMIMVILPVGAIFAYRSDAWLPCVTTLLAGFAIGAPLYLSWLALAFKKLSISKGGFVSMSLAGFCLLDASFAIFFSVPCFLICLALFGLSLLLQKIAPAT